MHTIIIVVKLVPVKTALQACNKTAIMSLSQQLLQTTAILFTPSLGSHYLQECTVVFMIHVGTYIERVLFHVVIITAKYSNETGIQVHNIFLNSKVEKCVKNISVSKVVTISFFSVYVVE